MRLKIGLDIDDTIAGFFERYMEVYNTKENPSALVDANITKNVVKLRYDKDFWTSLPVIDTVNFEPELYCTKRINPKAYTKQWLNDNGFPNKPIYQMVYQKGNKATMIKGKCDVLIDDSPTNVVQCLMSGMPALLIDRPHNQRFGPHFRIYSLDYEEIEDAYTLMQQLTEKEISLIAKYKWDTMK